MDVELPDGTIVQDVPEGTTKAQLMAKVGNFGQQSVAQRIANDPISQGARANIDPRVAARRDFMLPVSGKSLGETLGDASYALGGRVTDAGAAIGLPAPVSAGAGYLANVATQAIPSLMSSGFGSGTSGQLVSALRGPATQLENTTAAVRNAGYVMPPSTTNPNIINKLIESLGGKAATAQEATIKNQATTNELIRKALNAPSDMNITDETLSALANQRAQPYRDVAALPTPAPTRDFSNINPMRNPYPISGPTPQAPEALLSEWRDTNLRAKQYWNEFQRQGNVKAYDSYQELKLKSANLETAMEDAANQGGRPDLIPELRNARTEIAKIHDVERALNTDRGEVSALDLAKAKDRGVPLTGELETAAQMGNAFPKSVQRPENIGSPGVNNLNSMIGGGAGGVIGAMLGGGPIGAGIGGAVGTVATPAIQSLVRALLLSKPYQNTLGTSGNMSTALAKALGLSSPIIPAAAIGMSQQNQ